MSPSTLPIDLRFKGVGRINRRSGTTNPLVLKKIKRTLKELHQDGRLDILRAIRDRQLTALEVYDAARRRALHELPIGDTMPLLATAFTAWLDGAEKAGEYSTNHVANLRTVQRQLEARDAAARVADAPRLLEQLRTTYGVQHPRSFNYARAGVLAFVRATLKRSHAIYLSCAAVEPRVVKPKAARPKMSNDEMRERFPHRDTDALDAIAWSMATTGMHQKEYWGAWHTAADRVHIDGTKRGGRTRDVPLVLAPAAPPMSRDWFEKTFRKRFTGTMTPYDLRRAYSRWMEDAKIPRTRRRMYMGHGAKDTTDLYERHEIAAFLAEDAKKLKAVLGIPSSTSIAIAK